MQAGHSQQRSRPGLHVQFAYFSKSIPVLKDTEVNWPAKLGKEDPRGPA